MRCRAIRRRSDDGPAAASRDGHANAGKLPVARDELVRHLARNARDGRAWVLLARMDFEADRFDDAAVSYQKALTASAKVAADAGVWCEYADALGMAQGGMLAGKPRELVMRALALDPAHPKALEMAGSAAYEQRDFAAAASLLAAAARPAFRALACNTGSWRRRLPGPSASPWSRAAARTRPDERRRAKARVRPLGGQRPHRGQDSGASRKRGGTQVSALGDVDIVVVGGGISGLATAFRVRQARRLGRGPRCRSAARAASSAPCTATARSTRPARTARSTRRRSSTSCSTRSASAASEPMPARSPPRDSSFAAASWSRCRPRPARF